MSPRHDIPDEEETASSLDPSPASGSSPQTSPAEELEATAAMCHHCFDVLVKALKQKKEKGRSGKTTTGYFSSISGSSSSDPMSVLADFGQPDFVKHLPDQMVECPLFVTWDKRKASHNPLQRQKYSFELRGCIGTLSPRPLVSSIGEYALISALRDRRFHPVALTEVPELRVAVSLLVKYEPCDHCHDWHVGVHGIIIRWVEESRGVEYSATYLPEVASEQGWDQKTAVGSLIRKAGYHGQVTDSLLQRIECTRYQSSKQRVTFDEYTQERGCQEEVLALVSPSSASTVEIPDSSLAEDSFSRQSASSNCVIS